jgi:mannose-6-phosphate isomerase-like protein (cupin superfamily)
MTSPWHRAAVVLLGAAACLAAADSGFLRRQISEVQARQDDLTASSRGATYKPLFGAGDADAGQLKAVVRYGELTVAPGGASAVVSYAAEEQIYFVTEGSAILLYGDEKAPLKKFDFLYLPHGVKHGIANTSGAPVKVIVMGYQIPAGRAMEPASKLMLANADDVALQILGQHGPTTQFKLLMGTTTSKRDKLAAATVMNSLFLLDFAPGGTNIPHNHPAEEEIYLVLRGSGDMVAGRDADGKDVRHPVTQGAAFFFMPGTQVGFYSNAKEGEAHDLILAVRSSLPGGRARAQ